MIVAGLECRGLLRPMLCPRILFRCNLTQSKLIGTSSDYVTPLSGAVRLPPQAYVRVIIAGGWREGFVRLTEPRKEWRHEFGNV